MAPEFESAKSSSASRQGETGTGPVADSKAEDDAARNAGAAVAAKTRVGDADHSFGYWYQTCNKEKKNLVHSNFAQGDFLWIYVSKMNAKKLVYQAALPANSQSILKVFIPYNARVNQQSKKR